MNVIQANCSWQIARFLLPDTTDKILGFLLTLFESLKVQIGSSVTEQIVQQLLHTFTRQQLSETLLHESSAGSRVINKFLKILQLLVQEPAASFKAFLPNIIGLCMEQLYPIIIEVCSLHFEISTSSTFSDFPNFGDFQLRKETLDTFICTHICGNRRPILERKF